MIRLYEFFNDAANGSVHRSLVCPNSQQQLLGRFLSKGVIQEQQIQGCLTHMIVEAEYRQVFFDLIARAGGIQFFILHCQ
jgi:hypothetical protein